MLTDRLEHTAQAVDKLLVTVGTNVEPSVSFKCHILGYPLEGNHLLFAKFLENELFVAKLTVGTAQIFHALCAKGVKNEEELLQGKATHETLCAAHALGEEIPNDFGILGAHHQAEHVGLRFLRLAVILTTAADEQEDVERHEGEHHCETSEMHGEAYQCAHAECHRTSKKPATDNAQHARDAEHGTFAGPGTVGKRSTHGHHEGDIGGGKGEFIVGTDDDEHGGEHEVDGCTYHVERCIVGQDHFLLVETGVYPALCLERNDVGKTVAHILCHTHNAPRGLGRTEHLIALVLTAQVYTGLDDVLGFLRRDHGDNHDDAGAQQEKRRSLGTLGERGHHERVGVGAMSEPVVEGVESGKRNADEVDQVVASKGHGKRKGTHEHHHPKHVDAQQIEQLCQHRGNQENAAHERERVGVNPVAR